MGCIAATKPALGRHPATRHTQIRMVDYFPELSPAALRQRADACRALATISETVERKTLWLDRASYWQELSLRAVERRLQLVKAEPR
jgi:hypothetical protein